MHLVKSMSVLSLSTFGISYMSKVLFEFCWMLLRFMNFKDCGWASLLYEVPGGKQVDGIPPVACTTGAARTAATLAGRNL